MPYHHVLRQTADDYDDFLDGFGPSADPAPDDRAELLASISSTVGPYTRPVSFVVQLRVQGRPEQTYRLQRPQTASEATLLVLAHLVSELDAPARISLALDDPTVERFLAGEIPAPHWLCRAAGALEYEAAIVETTVTIEHIDLADCLAPRPLGYG